MTIDITSVPDTDTDKKLAFALCQKFTKARQQALGVETAQSVRKWDHQAMYNMLVRERESSGMSPLHQAKEVGDVLEFMFSHPVAKSWIGVVEHPEAFTKQYLDIATSWLRAGTVKAQAAEMKTDAPTSNHIAAQAAHSSEEWDQIHYENTGDDGSVTFEVTPESTDPERMLAACSTREEALAAMHAYVGAGRGRRV